MLKTYQFKTHCKGGSHFARTHDKTKVNVLMAASEMVFKFIELHYVGWNNSSHPSWTAYYISLADASGKGRYIEVLAVIRTIIRKRDTVWSGIPCSKCCALGHHFLSCTEEGHPLNYWRSIFHIYYVYLSVQRVTNVSVLIIISTFYYNYY